MHKFRYSSFAVVNTHQHDQTEDESDIRTLCILTCILGVLLGICTCFITADAKVFVCVYLTTVSVYR